MTTTNKYTEYRPADISGFIGQEKLLHRLLIHCKAAVMEQRVLEHTLLTGPPGFGKTTLANLLGQVIGDPVIELTMPITEKTLQRTIKGHDGIILLDEVHSASKKIQEQLMQLLSRNYIQTNTGLKIEAGFLTIVAATTEPEKVIAPLFDRFRIKPVFEDYSDEDMGKIVANMAGMAGLDMSEEIAVDLGRATGGTPRNAAELIDAARALLHDMDHIPSAKEILDFCEIDPDGLNKRHMQYLRALAQFGGQRGLSQIATVLRLNEGFVVELERLLFKLDLINYGSQGRELTEKGARKIKEPRSEGRRIIHG